MKLITKQVAALLLSAMLLSGCAIFDDSYQAVPPTPLSKFKPTLKIRKIWSNNSSYGPRSEYLRLAPVYANGSIFTSSYNGYLTKIDAQTGRTTWKTNLNVSLSTGLFANNNLLFVGTGRGQLLAINQSDSKVTWWQPFTNELLATPYCKDSAVLAKAANGELSAFNINNGTRLWTYNHIEPSLILRGSSSPRIFGNYAVAGFASGDLVAFNLRSGRILWQRAIAIGQGTTIVQQMVDIDVSPKINNNVIYVATYQGNIAAVSLYNGRTLWQHKISSYTGLATDNKNVYISDADGNVWAFSAKTGEVLWKQSALTNRSLTAPTVIDNCVVVGDAQGYLHFISTVDGHFTARVRISKFGISATPIVANGFMYVYANHGYLIKLQPH